MASEIGRGDPYRWTLEEFVLRCRLGTEIREVITEGLVDRDVIQDALARWGESAVEVLDAGHLDITEAETVAAGFSPGVKGELLTLAASLQEAARGRPLAAEVVIVVDRDYDGETGLSPFALATDGHSLESYGLNERALQRMVRVGLAGGKGPGGAGKHTTGRQLYDRVVPAAVKLSAARKALQDLSTPPGLGDRWSRYATVGSDGSIEIRADKMLANRLVSLCRKEDVSEVMERYTDLVEVFSRDHFAYVRGHDFVALLHKLLADSWGRKRIGRGCLPGRPDDTARVLLLAVDTSELDQTELFQSLRQRFCPGQAKAA
jgi:hypothetical protein